MRLFPKRLAQHLRLYTGTDEQPEALRALFVSHEATRTGAPKIILNLLRHFTSETAVACDTLLHNGGHLIGEFAAHSSVHCLELPRRQDETLQRRMTKLFHRHLTRIPDFAVCNSMESRFIAHEIHRYRVPIVFLIHELPSSYRAEDFDLVHQVASQVVFPVATVRDSVLELAPQLADCSVVLSQGLLNPDFANGINRNLARQLLCQELGIDQGAHVVLGCGTLDLRKGIDQFVLVARELLSRNNSTQDFHFVWVGDGPRWTHSAFHYVQMDIEKTPARGRVHFIGERTDVAPYFVASDVFLLSSRVDPFPCVIHEAMASKLPVVAFDQAGGATEALADGAGIVVPFGDYQRAADEILTLAQQPLAAERIRRKAFGRVHREYLFSHYAEQVIGVVETTLGRPLPRRESYSRSQVRRAA